MVVRDHEVRGDAFQVAAHHDDLVARIDQPRQLAIFDPDRGEEDAIDAFAAQILHQRLFTPGVSTRADQDQIVATPRGFAINGCHQIGIERVGDAGDHDRQGTGAVRDQAARQLIGAEIELGNRLLDANAAWSET